MYQVFKQQTYKQTGTLDLPTICIFPLTCGKDQILMKIGSF